MVSDLSVKKAVYDSAIGANIFIVLILTFVCLLKFRKLQEIGLLK